MLQKTMVISFLLVKNKVPYIHNTTGESSRQVISELSLQTFPAQVVKKVILPILTLIKLSRWTTFLWRRWMRFFLNTTLFCIRSFFCASQLSYSQFESKFVPLPDIDMAVRKLDGQRWFASGDWSSPAQRAYPHHEHTWHVENKPPSVPFQSRFPGFEEPWRSSLHFLGEPEE